MKMAEFKLIDHTNGALTWRIVDRIQKTLQDMPKNTLHYFSSTVAQNQGNAIVIDMNVPKREIIISQY